MNPGETLNIGKRLTQSDGSYFILQSDGNLQYVSSSGAVLWETGPTGGNQVTLDINGRLAINDGTGNSKWSYNSPPGSSLTAKNGVPVLDNGVDSDPFPTYGNKLPTCGTMHSSK